MKDLKKYPMKAIDKDLEVLKKFEIKTNWREKSLYRKQNHRWMKYSGYIALAVIRKLKEMGLTKKELAQRMNCTPQYISKIVKGSENLTLETISKLEECLDIDLLSSGLTMNKRYKPSDEGCYMVAEPPLLSRRNGGTDRLH